MSLSDLLYESRHRARLRKAGWKFKGVEEEEPEYCDSPGRSGCGCCPGCEDWADEEFERKRDKELDNL